LQARDKILGIFVKHFIVLKHCNQKKNIVDLPTNIVVEEEDVKVELIGNEIDP